MNQRQHHWLEKSQVQVLSLLILGAFYFGLWRLFAPPDPRAPLIFLPLGQLGALAGLAGIVWGISLLAGAVMVRSRPEGALVAMLVGLGGLSLRSPQFRGLLWYRQEQAPSLFGAMLLETLLLVAILAGAVVAMSLGRRLAERIAPGWLWTPPADSPEGVASPRRGLLGSLCWGLDTPGARTPWASAIASFVVSVAASVVFMMIFVRSPDRGQVLFGLVAGFALGTLTAHQLAPARLSTLYLLGPAIVGSAVYVLAMATPLADAPNAWTQVRVISRVLPIDWLSAGCGGAALGYWMSSRIHESRRLERQAALTDTSKR